jgi:hypothetical protein
VGNSANLLADKRLGDNFSRKSPIGTTLVRKGQDQPAKAHGSKKGDYTMSGSKFQRHLIAAFASLLMSTIAVGAAVAPAQVSAAQVEVVTYV